MRALIGQIYRIPSRVQAFRDSIDPYIADGSAIYSGRKIGDTTYEIELETRQKRPLKKALTHAAKSLHLHHTFT